MILNVLSACQFFLQSPLGNANIVVKPYVLPLPDNADIVVKPLYCPVRVLTVLLNLYTAPVRVLTDSVVWGCVLPVSYHNVCFCHKFLRFVQLWERHPPTSVCHFVEIAIFYASVHYTSMCFNVPQTCITCMAMCEWGKSVAKMGSSFNPATLSGFGLMAYIRLRHCLVIDWSKIKIDFNNQCLENNNFVW